MRLVLQCAVCGTCHPVGTDECSACRATGVRDLRLMFECPACLRLGLSPFCGACPPPLPYQVIEDAEADVPPFEVVEDGADAGGGFDFTPGIDPPDDDPLDEPESAGDE